MSDANSINAVLGQRVNAGSGSESAPNLKIVEIPEPLENVERTQNIRGEVTRKDKDGAIHIRTDKGEIKAQPERRVNVDVGTKVEIRIDKGNPPQTANLRPAQQQPKAELQQPSLTNITTNVALPPNLSIQKLVNAPPINVELLTPRALLNVIQPYIENIAANLNLVSNSPILLEAPASFVTPLQGFISEVTTLNLSLNENFLSQNIATALPFTSTLETPNLSLPPDNQALNTALQTPVTEIPLSVLVAKLISSPTIEPITFDKSASEAIALSRFSEVKITNVLLPNVQIPDETQPALAPLSVSEPAPERAGDVRAVLTGFTEDKHFPVLQITKPESFAHQHYSLQTPVEDIPIGTQIELQVTQSITLATPDSTQISTVAFPSLNTTYFLTPEIWPVFQEIKNILVQVAPQAIQASFNNIIPNPGTPAQLGNAALFFIAAVRSGDLQSWLGDKTFDALRRAGKSDLINRLGTELTSLGRFSSEPMSHEWRALTLPLAWQDDIYKIVMHYRREDDGGSDEDQAGGTKTRFIMDLSLSQMGKVQLDGLFVGKTDGIGRLDLILRTEQGFSEAMKMEMRQTYKGALDDTNFTGELSFQDQKDQWVQITPDALSEFSEDI